MSEQTGSGSYHERIANQGPRANVPASGGVGALPYAEAPKRRSGRWAVFALLALLGLGAAVASAASGGSSSSDDAAGSVGETPPRAEAPATTEAAVTTSEVPSTTQSPPTTEAPTTVPAATADIAVEDLPRHEAVYRDGKLVLQGTVPSAEFRDRFRDEAAAVIGAENVIVRYQIDPRVPEPTDGRVRVDEDFLFATGSARIDDQYRPLMDLGVTVMELNPQARMRIIGHTDDVGSDGANQSLAQARAGALRDYLSFNGIDPERIEAIGAGEAEPVVANDSPANRAQNRRIEVELIDLLVD